MANTSKNQKTPKRLTAAERAEAMDEAQTVREFANFNKIKLSEKQHELYKGMESSVITTVTGPPGTSKAQPLTSKILTPDGWTLMGDLNVGDNVISVDGKSTKITGIFPQGIKTIYSITFSDGATTECTGDHLWHTWTHSERVFYKKENGKKIRTTHPGIVRNTYEMIGNLYGKDGRLNFSIPIVAPVIYEEKEFVIHPYLLGALIGDGHFGRYIGFSTKDSEIFEKVNEILDSYNYKLSIRNQKNNFKECAIVCNVNTNRNLIREELGTMGLLNKKSQDKMIPTEYFIGSVGQRMNLLRGLLDTDGYVSRGNIRFGTSSKQLCSDMITLVRSLGGTCTYSIRETSYPYNGKILAGLDHYDICINLPNDLASSAFTLERKQSKVKERTKYLPVRYITSIQEVRNDLAQCISVEHDSKLYVTDDYIVTHNTFTCCYHAIKLLQKGEIKKIILTKPLETSGEDIGFLPGTEKDKTAPFLNSFLDNLKEMTDGKSLKMMFDTGVIEFVPVAFMRGRTFKDAMIILDEAQNLDIKQLMTFITRFGTNSRVAIIGDGNQNDINSKYVALDYFIDKILGHDPEMFHFKFDRNDIVRHPLLIKIVDNYEAAQVRGDIPQTKKNN